MILFDRQKNPLFISDAPSFRRTLEGAVKNAADLTNLSLRRASLKKAALDDLFAPQADFWGGNFCGADLTGAVLSHADLRVCRFNDACLAQADLTACDLTGASFSGTILQGCRLRGALLSCPSFFACDYTQADLTGAVYRHQGEVDIPLNDTPIRVSSRFGHLVFFEPHVLYAGVLIPIDLVKDNHSLAAQH